MNCDKNIGPKNRAARITTGAALMLLSIYASNPLQVTLVGVGLFMIFAWCFWNGYRGAKDMR